MSFAFNIPFKVERAPSWTNPYITDGLVGYWDGEWNAEGGKHDDALDLLVDLSGGGHDMTFVGTHQLNDKSVTIDGVANAYGTINGLTWGPQSTQEFIVNLSAVDNYGRLIAEQRGLGVMKHPEGFAAGYCYGFNTDGPIGSYVRHDLGVAVNLSLSFGEDKIVRFYINGLLSGERSESSFSSSFSGQTTFFNRTTGSRGITGQLHAVRLYNRALSAEEIASNYAIDARRFGL